MTMTEDIVNEICKAGIKLCSRHYNDKRFIIIHDAFHYYIREVFDEGSDFYPYGEKIKLDDVELSEEAKDFISDVDWLNKNMGLLFLVNSKTIEMYFCSESCDGFEPELKFVFKRTFDGLFD